MVVPREAATGTAARVAGASTGCFMEDGEHLPLQTEAR